MPAVGQCTPAPSAPQNVPNEVSMTPTANFIAFSGTRASGSVLPQLRGRERVGDNSSVTDLESSVADLEKPAGAADEQAEPSGWLVLIYRVPSEPTRLRSTVWRRIKSLGAIYLQN
jgi:hypothetical protein